MQGLFVVFEGVECSGKSTQAQMLSDFCAKRNIPCLGVREPGSTPFGERLRSLILGVDCTPMAEFLAFSASRAQLVESLIRPALDEGKVVICDRFFYSSLVYQGFARGINTEVLMQITRHAIGGLEPRHAFLIDPSFESAQKRLAQKQGRDRIESEGLEFHKKIYQGYNALPSLYPALIKVDGRPSPDAVHLSILNILSQEDSRFYS